MAARRQNLTAVFVDSSVLFAAVLSPTGGSAKLFTLDKIKPQTSKVVLAEVERNVRAKGENYHIDRFFMLADKLELLDQVPNNLLIASAKKAIVEKDAVILAEAKQIKAKILVTLDKKHFLSAGAKKFLAPGKILTPKELIELEEVKDA